MDILDVRDLTTRFEELEDLETPDEDEQEERTKLDALLGDMRGYGGDHQWRGDWYPITLIADESFEEYAQDLAEDIGAIQRDAQWPNNHIDWKAAAEALQQDYSSVEYDGTTYWYR